MHPPHLAFCSRRLIAHEGADQPEGGNQSSKMQKISQRQDSHKVASLAIVATRAIATLRPLISLLMMPAPSLRRWPWPEQSIRT